MALESAFPQLALVKNGGRYNLQPVTLDGGGVAMALGAVGSAEGSMPGSADSLSGFAPGEFQAGFGVGGYLGRSDASVELSAPPSLSQQRSTPPFSYGPQMPYHDQAPESPILLPGNVRGDEMAYFGMKAGMAPSAPSSPPARSAPESVDKLRGKLLDLGSSFVGFDKIVEEDTFRRRQVEQQRVQEVLDGLARLEKAVDVEIRRRIDMNKATEDGMEKLLSDMLNTIQGRILTRFDRICQSMETLFERCSTLERGIQQLRGELPTKHQVESNALVHTIKELGHDFENDRKQRVDQDNHFLRLIQDSEHGVDRRMEQQLEILEKRAEAIKGSIDEFAIEEEVPVSGARAKILEETARVRASIFEEERRRELSDDEVVQAINEYTNALHRSLSKTNA